MALCQFDDESGICMSKLSPFDFINSINDKKYLMVDPEVERQYVPFVVNRSLSSFIDTMPFLDFLNRHSGLPNKMQYDYLYHGLRKMKRYGGKWNKNTNHEYLDDIKKYYQVSSQKAAEIVDRLSEEQLHSIRRKLTNFGGRIPTVNTP